MKRITIKKYSLKTLKNKFDESVFVIPQIQRRYVWDKNRVKKLADSIISNYPIGVFLIWKTDGHKVAGIKQSRKTILPSFNFKNQTAELIIDGQQRLTSLYGILKNVKAEENTGGIGFDQLYVDLDIDANERFSFKKKINSGDNCILLSHCLEWTPTKIKQAYKLKNNEMKILVDIKARFSNYKFIAIEINTNDIEKVKETFIRINSQGMSVQQADVIFTKMTNIDLRERVEALKMSKAFSDTGFHKIKSESLIYTCALFSGEKMIGKIALDSFQRRMAQQRLTNKEFDKTWKNLYLAFENTIDFLRAEFGVNSYSLLPSDNLFTMLALFFAHSKRRNPTSSQKHVLKRWFWHTCLSERYSGASFNRNIPSDIQLMISLGKGNNVNYYPKEKIDPMDFFKMQMKTSSNSSAFKGFYLLLLKKKPLILETGEKIIIENTVSISNRKDKHHIFPKKAMSHLTSRWIDSILNMCILVSSENQSISSKAPRFYLNSYKRKRYFSSFLASHCLPKEGLFENALRDGFLIFLNKRGPLLIRKIEEETGFNGGKLFTPFQKINRL